VNPENSAAFRLARLTLMLAVVGEFTPEGIDAERLGMYDFLAAHPLLLAREDTDPDRLALQMAGFDDNALGYASAAQRFVTGQLRLPGDLGVLIGRGLVEVTMDGRIRYRLTDQGQVVARQFTAMYSQAYTAAARVVLRRARRLSGRKLRENMRQWLTVIPEPTVGRLDPAHVIDLDSDSLDSDTGAPPSTRTAWRTGFPEDET
jgi:hypothetical protein